MKFLQFISDIFLGSTVLKDLFREEEPERRVASGKHH
jgi:hypothetical protein